MVPVGELDLELDPREVGRGRPEDECVAAWVEGFRERRDASVGVRLPDSKDFAVAAEFDADAARRPAGSRVEDVCRDGRGHGPDGSPGLSVRISSGVQGRIGTSGRPPTASSASAETRQLASS